MKQIMYIFLASLIIVASCNKELGKLPENAKVEGNTIIDQKTAIVGLNGAYYQFANVQSSNNVTSWMINEVIPGYYSGYLGYGYDGTDEEDNIYNINDDTWWTYSYSIINAANGVIQAVEALADGAFTGNTKKQILSEARFLRAYGHFKLLSYYAEWFDVSSSYGVLLRHELVTLSNISKKRSTVAESYKSIMDDLDYAIANGPDSTSNIYASKWAAMVLKMRVLMSHGQLADHTAVINLANEVINSNKYQLEGKAIDIFRTKGLTSKEVILGVKPQQNQEAYYYNLSRQYWPGASALFVAKTKLKDLLQDDPREAWLIGTANTYTPGTFFFTKYIAQGSTPTVITETAYAIRLSEVSLLKAEAIVRSGGNPADAKNLLKDIMGRGGVTNFQAIDDAATNDELLKQVYFEISRNLVGEDGQDWLALLRMPFSFVQATKPTITDKIQYILPVPHNELQNNPAFGDQNKCYQR